MKTMKIFPWAALACAVLFSTVKLTCQTKTPAAETDLLSWGAGALVVQAPPSYSDSGDWSPDALLDELPNTGWANPAGDLTPKVFVF